MTRKETLVDDYWKLRIQHTCGELLASAASAVKYVYNCKAVDKQIQVDKKLVLYLLKHAILID